MAPKSKSEGVTRLPDDPETFPEAARRRALEDVQDAPTDGAIQHAPRARRARHQDAYTELLAAEDEARRANRLIPTALSSRIAVVQSGDDPVAQPTDTVLGPNMTYKQRLATANDPGSYGYAVWPWLKTAAGFALPADRLPWLKDRAAAFAAYSLVTARSFDDPALRDGVPLNNTFVPRTYNETPFNHEVLVEYRRIIRDTLEVREDRFWSRREDHLEREADLLRGWPSRQQTPMVFFAMFATGPTPTGDQMRPDGSSILTKGNRIALREILSGIKPRDHAQTKAHTRARRAYEATTPQERERMMNAALTHLVDPSPTAVTDALWDAFVNLASGQSDHEARLSRLEDALGIDSKGVQVFEEFGS